MKSTLFTVLAGSLAATLFGLATPAGTTPAPHPHPEAPSNAFEIKTLSNRADLISGGDALVQLDLPARLDLDEVSVRLGHRDVTQNFTRQPNGSITGLVEHLALGKNRLTVRSPSGEGAALTITNHPKGGPVFSGRQVQPWRCETKRNGLGPPVDDKCNAPTVQRTFSLGEGVKATFERGTINRGVYDLIIPENWNHKLIWHFGAGTGQQYRQGTTDTIDNSLPLPAALAQANIPDAVRKGFAVASSSMTNNSQHSNDVTSAETVMMVKEHIIERHGEIVYTIGRGGSGGALQQYLIADAYPGLLDGLLPTMDWQDQITGAYREFADCALLTRYMDSSPLWSDSKDRTAVFGHGGTSVCDKSSERAIDYMKPDDGTTCAGDASFDAATNPNGVRCTLQDFMVSIYGQRPGGCEGHGRPCARRPWGNVGVQYGLIALRSGEITLQQFVDLNTNVGGFDINMNWTPHRTKADIAAVRIAHRTGRVTFGRGLELVPIIVERSTDNDDYHYPWRTYVTQNRLVRANGHHLNHVVWTNGTDGSTLHMMDKWLSAIEADKSSAALATKVIRHKPRKAVDACWINGVKTTDDTACRDAFPVKRDTRVAAGGRLTSDILKCQLRPLRRSDYPGNLTDSQWKQLRAAFPSGVCDYSKPGIGQVDPLTGGLLVPTPWVTFAGRPGGEPLGPPPSSTTIS